VIDIAVGTDRRESLIAAWSEQAHELQQIVGWTDENSGTRVRRFEGGASLVLLAPIDGLYAACEINEYAWQRTVEMLGGQKGESTAEEDITRLRALVAEERQPDMLDLTRRAESSGLLYLSDDEEFSLGSGRGSMTWPIDGLPAVNAVPWTRLADVPILLVTGTNGKSTTVRMLASIARAAGRTPGFSSTDGLWIGDESVDTGDYSGPEGARTVLRNRGTDIAILETARGGMLRRGLGVRRADAVALLNVAEDHLGEYGVTCVDDLVETKFIIRRAVHPDRPMVLNADDPLIVEYAQQSVRSPITWFSLDAGNPVIVNHLHTGGAACVAKGQRIQYSCGDQSTDLAEIKSIPATMDGRARFNVSNALAAVGLAMAIDLPKSAIAAGLGEFRSDPESNPGRGNMFELGGVTAIVDFVHNAHGMNAFMTFAKAMPAARRLITLGMAGDRTDHEIREFVRSTWAGRPDRIVLKEMEDYLRGREAGSILDLMADELVELGAPSERIARTGSETEALRHALEWSQPGDLLLLSIQAERAKVLDSLRQLQEDGWHPGDPLPE
jgi:cyanophycin synthetase